MPPLRERKDDIPLLIDFFINAHDIPCPPMNGNMIAQCLEYDWPGNVRELQNVIHRYISMRKLDFTGSSTARHKVGPSSSDKLEVLNIQDMLDRYEKEIIETALNRYQWHRSQVATILGINRKTLFKKMMKYGLKKPLQGAH